jgi:hypothetical protein
MIRYFLNNVPIGVKRIQQSQKILQDKSGMVALAFLRLKISFVNLHLSYQGLTVF